MPTTKTRLAAALAAEHLLCAPALADYYVCWAKPYDTSYKGPFLYGWGRTESAAREDALSFCAKRTGRDCYASCRKQKSGR